MDGGGLLSDFSDAGLIFLSLYGKTNLFFFACTRAGIDGSFSYPVAIHPEGRRPPLLVLPFSLSM